MATHSPRGEVAPKPASATTAPRTRQGFPGRTIGPVSDLERHLPSDWWRTLFNSVYLKTDGDVVENTANTRREIDQLVKATGIELNDRILDLCCGQGRHSLELASRGYRHVTGVDRSRYLIRLARKRARQINLQVNFHEGDARRFRHPENSFNCVAVMGNSFGYFAREEDDIAVLKQIKRVLRSGATLAMDLTDGEWTRKNFERRSWEWIDEDQFVCRERSLAADGARLVSREVVVHAERGVIADQFYAERLYNRETISKLLEEVGFTNIRFHNGVVTESDRNQDLGMMAQRMFITAQAPQKAVPSGSKRGPMFPKVTIIMGDPRLPDTVKRGGQFNAEDFETIERLKRALDELDEFEFSFLDNHAALLSELRANPPQFVLNFCDEGYQNNAFQELHVPAVLEMLGVPYTGAAPAALGLCYDKALVRAIADSLDVPVPLETYFSPDDQAATLPSAFPALVKPSCGDSSIGITTRSIVHSPNELVACVSRIRQEFPGRSVLVQEFLSGDEFTVGIVGNPGQRIYTLPILQVDFSGLDPSLPRILGYESKWEIDSPYFSQIKYCETTIDEDAQRRLIDYSSVLFERLGCRDYARFDFRADARGKIKLLEVNPNPGWCWDGKMNYMAEIAGLRYADLLRMIIDAAQERIAAGPVSAAAASVAEPVMVQ